MGTKSFKVDVNPALLIWARESAGYTVADVASHSGLSAADLAALESGRRKPNWASLRKLAAVYRRPVAAFLLPKPPQEAHPLTDFRTLAGLRGQYSPEVRFAIRTARWLTSKAAELQEKLQAPKPAMAPSIQLTADPEQAAMASRETFGVGLDQQASFTNPWQALKRWRAAVEEQNILVFQFRMPIADARGFSVVEMERPAIVLSQSDAPAARVFTLFHEYAHLLLERPGVCIPDALHPISSQRVETFCNRFAAALLVPRADLERRVPPSLSDNDFRQLARHYAVSRYVLLGRLQDMGAISAASYQQFSRRWHSQDAAAARRPQSGGGLTGSERCLLERGRPFVSLVVQAARQELITFSEANSFLGVKLKDFRRLARGA